MKRYLLFGFYKYYPSGGMNDFITSFDEVSELPPGKYPHDIYQIFDTQTENKEVINNGQYSGHSFEEIVGLFEKLQRRTKYD